MVKYQSEKAAFVFYSMASKDDAYSMFSMAQMIQAGKGGQVKDVNLSIQIYDEIIERAYQGWFKFEEMYPAYIMKWVLVVQESISGWLN